MRQTSLLAKVQKSICYYRMLETGEKVVVAVSGGPDSVALLYCLAQLNIRWCLDICVAHFDHRLRKGSKGDLDFVKDLAATLKLPFYSGFLDWKKEKRTGSLEDYLKNQRYRFLLQVAKKIHAKKIILGHTKDDQAETTLMRIVRGSGLYGLSAILPKRSMYGVEIVRPLIEVSRCEILTFLKKNKIESRTDETNFDEKFLRNKFRKKLLPLLEKEYNPNIKETLLSLSLLVGADYRYLQAQANRFLKRSLKKKKGIWVLPIASFNKLDIALQRLVLRGVLEKIHGHLRHWSFRHWKETEDLIVSRPLGSEVHLPFGITISKIKGYLHIFKR